MFRTVYLAFIKLYELGVIFILHSTQLQFQGQTYEEVKTVEMPIVECLEEFAGPNKLVRNGRRCLMLTFVLK